VSIWERWAIWRFVWTIHRGSARLGPVSQRRDRAHGLSQRAIQGTLLEPVGVGDPTQNRSVVHPDPSELGPVRSGRPVALAGGDRNSLGHVGVSAPGRDSLETPQEARQRHAEPGDGRVVIPALEGAQRGSQGVYGPIQEHAVLGSLPFDQPDKIIGEGHGYPTVAGACSRGCTGRVTSGRPWGLGFVPLPCAGRS
jgi:hypothetical protein